MRKVVIVGAGAMGCLFAARMVEGGADVTLVDVDKPRLEALAREGVSLSDDSGERVAPVKAGLSGEVSGPADLILMFTKGLHTAAAAKSVAHLHGGQTYALTLQNGVGNAEVMAEVFPPGRVLHGIAELPADLHGPTSVSSHGKGAVRLGGYTAAASAKGIRVDAQAIRDKIDYALAHHRGHKASMLQDRLAGRKTEIETINGAVVRAAEAVGVPTPVTCVLADLIRTIDQYQG